MKDEESRSDVFGELNRVLERLKGCLREIHRDENPIDAAFYLPRYYFLARFLSISPHDHDRTRRMLDNALGRAAAKEMGHAGIAVRRHHDQISRDLSGKIADLLESRHAAEEVTVLHSQSISFRHDLEATDAASDGIVAIGRHRQ